MKQDTFLFSLAILALGYVVWKNSKTESAPTELAETKNNEVPVDVVETTKVAANAAVTQPKYAQPTFTKDWVLLQNNVKNGLVTTSPFN